MDPNPSSVSLLWAGSEGLVRQSWPFVPGMTVADLRKQPDILHALAQAWDMGHTRARFGSILDDQQRLEPWDRVDLVRPLVADPKDARRKRVEALRAERARLGQTDRWTKNRG
ncbi:rnfH Protein RnfH [Burkholderiales bacterium]